MSLVTIPLACRYLERLWGIRELVRFTCVVIVASNVIAFGFAWLLYIVLGSDAVVYVSILPLAYTNLYSSGIPFHGMTALQSGVLVAFTQIIPEHQIQLFGVLKARVKVRGEQTICR